MNRNHNNPPNMPHITRLKRLQSLIIHDVIKIRNLLATGLRMLVILLFGSSVKETFFERLFYDGEYFSSSLP